MTRKLGIGIGARTLFLLMMVVALAVLVLPGAAGERAAEAAPSTPCPPPAPTHAGGGLWRVTATYPVTETINAEYACVTLTGAGGTLNGAVLEVNAAGCVGVLPAVTAGSDLLAADWQDNNCVAPGDVVVMLVRSANPVSGGSVNWKRTDLTETGDIAIDKVEVAGVGGIQELPAPAGAEASGVAGEGSGWSAGAYAGLAAGLAAAAVALGGGAWYARRRWLR